MAPSVPPSQGADTARPVRRGGPHPCPRDNRTSDDREGVLPACSTGSCRECTVKAPGVSTRGARRVATGNATPEPYFPRPTTARAASW
ncbi:ribonuclease domain-containing protein [Saccharothrix saharensis]|uniref:ribonuclease domain-containing protein n=1 Tax=Saccharothrix saharensis TaxID=571190 RepID=UPI00114F2B3F